MLTFLSKYISSFWPTDTLSVGSRWETFWHIKKLQEISLLCICNIDLFVLFMCKIYDIYDLEFYFSDVFEYSDPILI